VIVGEGPAYFSFDIDSLDPGLCAGNWDTGAWWPHDARSPASDTRIRQPRSCRRRSRRGLAAARYQRHDEHDGSCNPVRAPVRACAGSRPTEASIERLTGNIARASLCVFAQRWAICRSASTTRCSMCCAAARSTARCRARRPRGRSSPRASAKARSGRVIARSARANCSRRLERSASLRTGWAIPDTRDSSLPSKIRERSTPDHGCVATIRRR